MKANTFKKWILSLAAGLGVVTSAPATVWYSSMSPWTIVTRVDSKVKPNADVFTDKVFNIFGLTSPRFLSFITFYGPFVAPMYWVEIRYGGAFTTNLVCRFPVNAF